MLVFPNLTLHGDQLVVTILHFPKVDIAHRNVSEIYGWVIYCYIN